MFVLARPNPFYVLNLLTATQVHLRSGSSTKMAILVLNGNGIFDHLHIWHTDITLPRESCEMIKFGFVLCTHHIFNKHSSLIQKKMLILSSNIKQR